jgi:type II secretory pathway predicted ATPase ExeA
VLIIDEAQNLAGVTLEELRMLSNINTEKAHLLQLVLVGQPQLRDLLRHKDLEQFAQRITSDFHLGSLAPDEVPGYVNHRLSVAGRNARLFDDVAMSRISHLSKGVPRKINVLCDTALVYGFALEAPMITAEVIEEVVRDKARNGIFGSLDGTSGGVGRGARSPERADKKDTLEADRQSARLLFPSLSEKK